MTIIERAGKRLDSQSTKSLVELAADRLHAAPPGGSASEPPESKESAEPGRPSNQAGSVGEKPRQIVIDFERLRSMGFVPPADQSAVAEEFRLIKRPLLTVALASTES